MSRKLTLRRFFMSFHVLGRIIQCNFNFGINSALSIGKLPSERDSCVGTKLEGRDLFYGIINENFQTIVFHLSVRVYAY